MDLSPGIDFETKIFYKHDAARLLEQELSHPAYVVKPITIGANTDPYQPLERELRVTRSLLEVLERTRHPVSLISKGTMILRDLDLLVSLARDGLVNVFISVTTLDAAQQAGRPSRAVTIPLAHVARGPEWNLEEGFFRLVVDPESDAILGATFVGYEAGELIHVILAHMEAGSSWRVLERSVHIHPTFAEGIPTLARQLL